MKKNSTLFYLINRFQKDSYSKKKKIESLETIYDKAECAKMAPSRQTINNILGFAKSYEVMETERSGSVEMVLN